MIGPSPPLDDPANPWWGKVAARQLIAGLALAVTGLTAGAGAETSPELFAAQLDSENLGRFRVGGPDAIAGIGDWALGNGIVCASFADLGHESLLSDKGGVLVDLGHCGRDDDQWTVLQPMLNLSREEIISADSIRAEIDANQARLITTGHMHGVRMETVYSVGPAPSATLDIRTTLERESEGDAVFLVSDIAIHGNGQLTPFTLDTRGVGTSPGFEHPSLDVDDIFSGSDALVRADLQVLLGSRGLRPEIAYGWRLLEARIERADGTAEPLAHLAMNDQHFSNIATYTDTLFIGGEGPPGLLELAHLAWMDLDAGDRVVVLREIRLGKQATAASITDPLWPAGTEVRGTLGARFASLLVLDPDDRPITYLESGRRGEFSFRLPPGAAGPHRIAVRTCTGDQHEIPFEVPPGQAQIDLPWTAAPLPGRVGLPRGFPVRLTFIGLGATPTPRIRADGRQFRVGDHRIAGHAESNHYSQAGVESDRDELYLAPGRYRVLASRGPLWSVSVLEVDVEPGRITPLVIDPPVRLLDHPGWVSADLHVHAAPSEDSNLPLRQRIADFVAMGAEVVVSTEHDNVFDYAPVIEAMGLAGAIQSFVGVEITSTYQGPATPHTAGHSNAFPLIPQSGSYRGGAPRSQNRRLRSIIEDVRALPGSPILQLNHPREGDFDSGLGSYFSHLSVMGTPHDPTQPLDAPANRALIERAGTQGLRDLDFDAVELLNGKSMNRYRIARADWFAFLLQGEIRTATANSDSHNARETVALPVNYVAYAREIGPARLDAQAFTDSVRQGRLFGSTGPLLDAKLGSRGPGQRYPGKQAELRIGVRAAPWVPVEEVRVFVNGALHSRHPLKESGEVRMVMTFETDAFVTVEVEGKAQPGSIYAQVAPGYTPFAFTNPIFVDADGDGRWTPPGLPSPVPATLANPRASP